MKVAAILSRSDNLHANIIQDILIKNGVSVSRINFDFDNLEMFNSIDISLGLYKDSQPDVVFVHHPRISCQSDWFTDDIERKLFIASWDSAKDWMEVIYDKSLWMNRPSSILNNRNILNQLKLASELGFTIPETIFTNDLHVLKEFAGDSKIVIKQGNLGVHLEKKRILTSIINLAAIDGALLKKCPCFFQKYIEKKFEIRVHVIGENVLTCKIDSQKSNKTAIDWRNYDLENTPHESFQLDKFINYKLIELVRRLGLEFGIIDLIITPNDDLVFLECNSQGHWLWIEELTSIPITKAVCDHLMNSDLV